MSIYVAGDIHGGIHANKLFDYRWPEKKGLTMDDTLIILGDFGVIFNVQEDKNEVDVFRYLFSLPCQLCFVDGNHENFDRIDVNPITEKWGGKVQIVKTDDKTGKHIYRLRRGEVFTIEGKTIFTFGGALSVDKCNRKEYITWWSQEQHTFQELVNGDRNLKAVDYKVDYVLTHTCSKSTFNLMCKDAVNGEWKADDIAMDNLQKFHNKLDFTSWHFGHFHFDGNVDKFFCHFQEKPYKLV